MNRQGTLTLGRREHVEGRHPLAELAEPDWAAGQLQKLAGYPHSGDLILLGAWREGEVITFEDQVASHGGLGGPQDYPFLIYPVHVAPALDGLNGPLGLYEHFIHYQLDAGEEDSTSCSELTSQVPAARRKVS
jgi:hypothetical protein